MASNPSTGQWNLQDTPKQMGRVAVIMGANSGTGFQVAKVLARLGATDVLGCRNPDMAQTAIRALPLLRAALDPGARGGEYYEPSGFLELTGVVRTLVADAFPSRS